MLPLLYPCLEAILFLLPQPSSLSIPMESVQHLSTESFSMSWIANLDPSTHIFSRSHSFDSFIEMDLGLISQRWTSDKAPDFDFSFPDSQATVLVHAEDIFANGAVVPLHHVKRQVASESTNSILSRALSVDSSQRFLAAEHQSKSWLMLCTPLCSPHRDRKRKLRNYFGSPRKVLQKYFFFLVPLYRKVKGSRVNTDKSPGTRVQWCCSSSTTDNRIYDAILHCKKSIGQHC